MWCPVLPYTRPEIPDNGGSKMDLREPASLVMPPGVAAVLRILAGADAGFTGRQVARLAGMSPARTAEILAEFVRHGVVTVESAGPSQLCRLNQDHLLAGPLVALVTTRQSLLVELTGALGSWPVRPLHASLFGSAARGDGAVDSDLDVLVVHRTRLASAEQEQWDQQLHETGQALRDRVGNSVSWFSIDRAGLQRARRANEPIVLEWQRDGIHLLGERLNGLLLSARIQSA